MEHAEEPRADLESLKAIIVRFYPEHTQGRFVLLTAGWDSIAVDADDCAIFKFPRHVAAEQGLLQEARLLAFIRPALAMRVPDLTIHPGPPLFSRHDKIPGEHLLTQHCDGLGKEVRQRLAADMALFFAQLHALDMQTAPAPLIRPWLPADDILRRAWPVLPPGLRAYTERMVTTWQDLPPDPHGTTFGFFDGHGWNMAFDHAQHRLNGVYDFADSGIGPLHQEFTYPNWISPDLTERIVREYEALTGRLLDRRRITLLSGILRLSELAEYAEDARHLPNMLQNVMDWAAYDTEV